MSKKTSSTKRNSLGGAKRVPSAPKSEAVVWLQIGTVDELRKNEKKILERIARTPNGGNLFMTNPFLLLTDLGVDLSQQVKDSILSIHTNLSSASSSPYIALKTSNQAQSVRFHIRSLFDWRKLK